MLSLTSSRATTHPVTTLCGRISCQSIKLSHSTPSWVEVTRSTVTPSRASQNCNVSDIRGGADPKRGSMRHTVARSLDTLLLMKW